MRASMLMRKIKKIYVIIFWLCVWQIVYMIIGRDVLFASPIGTARALLGLMTQAEFYKTIGCSFLRIALGFFLGTAAGILLGAVTGASRLLYELFKPAIDLVRAAPVASFIILALTWLKTGNVPIFISFLTVIPII